MPSKKFFGLKSVPAKVRVFVELPDPAPAPEKTNVGIRVAADPITEDAPATTKEGGEQEQEHKSKRRRNRRRKSSSNANSEAANVQAAQPQREEEPTIEPDEQMLAKAEAVTEYVKSVLAAMGAADAVITPRFTANGIRFTLSGPDLGVVIGRRGETLDALQYLAGLVANRMDGDYLRITIDSGNYREKRERTLEALARKLALQAVRTGKNQTLEPMNPYERRIIHAAVSQVRGATSSSIGEEPNRRVVIKSTLPARSGSEGGSGRSNSRGGNRSRGGRSNRGDRPANPANKQPQSKVINSAEEAASKSTIAPVIEKREPKRLEDQEIHLYGKIEL
ncbi:MAG: KH domain-containing protein [Oscillospiraceae bacterium]|nr:KH domain-containing protein [Oscillospiraceae bacterium]